MRVSRASSGAASAGFAQSRARPSLLTFLVLSVVVFGFSWISHGCGPTVREPQPGEKDVPIPFEGCFSVEGGYLPNLDSPDLVVTHHDIEVGVQPETHTLAAVDAMTVEAVAPSNELLVFLDTRFTVSFIKGETGDVKFPIECGLGEVPSGQYLRLRLPQELPIGEKVTLELHYGTETEAFELENPVTQPVPIELEGQIASSSVYFVEGLWHPIPVHPYPATANIDVLVPQEEFRAAASGRFNGSALDAAGWMRWSFSQDIAQQTPLGYGLVATPLDEPLERQLETGTRVVVMHAGDSRSDGENTLEQVAGMTAYFETMLGPWSGGTLTVAEVTPVKGEALGMSPGIVVISDDVRRGEETGFSYIFDMLARQWLQVAWTMDGRLVEGLVQYLAADFGERTKRLGEWRETYLEARANGSDVALADLGITDELYVPVAYGKGALVLAMLERTIGEEPFALGLQNALRGKRDGPDPVFVDVLQASMEEASGQELTGFFDLWYRSTAVPELKLSCKDGALAGELAEPLLLTVVLQRGDEAVELAFKGTKRATAAVECKDDGEFTAMETLVVIQ